jgi:15-cis-phytoene synthase
MDLYLRNALDCSKITTKNYSTSFSLGIRLLHPEFRDPVYAVYGFVRYADEIVDTFFEQDQRALMASFRDETHRAIRDRFSTNPMLHSYQWVVNTYGIDHQLIDAFLHSMTMDLEQKEHDREGFTTYVYGSAEVVGLMCLKIFCNGNDEQYKALLPAARRLGEAFQKVNFLRDLRSDFDERGRSYFPDIDLKRFSNQEKTLIEQEILSDFDAALEGIHRLPANARLGVYLAYAYYRTLFRKIQRLPASMVLQKRIRISNSRKMLILLASWFRVKTGGACLRRQ